MVRSLDDGTVSWVFLFYEPAHGGQAERDQDPPDEMVNPHLDPGGRLVAIGNPLVGRVEPGQR